MGFTALTNGFFTDTFIAVIHRKTIGKEDENQITDSLEFVRVHFDWSELFGHRGRCTSRRL